MALSAPGIGSNLDVNGIVTQLMALERRPLDALDRKEAGYQARLSAYGALQGALSAFEASMRGMTPSRFDASTAAAADTSVLTATAGVGAASGEYDLTVSQLARAHTIQAAGVADDNAASSTGTISLRVGSGPVTTITLDSSNNTVRGLRDAINAAAGDVSAVIVNDGTASPYRLVLTARSTGAVNTISITNNLSAGELRTALEGASDAQAAQDATLNINGVAITSASNRVADAIEGVTLNLLKAGTTSVSVSRDRAQAQSAVQSFVNAYNEVNRTLADLTAYDASTGRAGQLIGDWAANTIRAEIRAALSADLAGLGGNLRRLSQIGVAFQRDGSLAIDTPKLESALDESPGDVGGLFAPQGRSTSTLLSYVSSSGATGPADYDVDITSAATQAVAMATAALAESTVIGAGNDTVSLTVDGVATGALTLSPGTYTRAELAAALQSAIDGSSSLAAAGVTVTVTLDADRLQVASARYGSASTVSLGTGSAAAALGFAGTEVAAGADVAGTFRHSGISFAASGSGQILSAAAGTAAEGLKIRYVGTPSQVQSGTDAILHFSRGYAAHLESLATRLLAAEGPIGSRTEGVNASLKDVARQRSAAERRLGETEERLRAQFTALDTLIGRLNSTSSYLQQQLASLPSFSNNQD